MPKIQWRQYRRGGVKVPQEKAWLLQLCALDNSSAAMRMSRRTFAFNREARTHYIISLKKLDGLTPGKPNAYGGWIRLVEVIHRFTGLPHIRDRPEFTGSAIQAQSGQRPDRRATRGQASGRTPAHRVRS